MGDGFAFFDIILFAFLAGFLVLKLRSVLGRRTGNEQRRPDPFANPREELSGNDNVVQLPDRAGERKSGPDATAAEMSGLMRLKMADPSFEEIGFLKGAKKAFEWIVDSFAKGDAEALRPLLSDALFGRFADAIEAREQAGETQETRIASMRSALIGKVELTGSLALVEVEFVTDQVKVTRDAKGEVVDGDPDRIETVTDLWTFERDISDPDPNWRLVATRVPEE